VEDDKAEWAVESAIRNLHWKSTGNSVDSEKWGMTDIKIARIYFIDRFFLDFAVPVSDHPGWFKVTIPIWCEGTDLNGQPVKRQMKAAMIMEGVRLVDYEFVEQSPLTFFHQAVTLLICSYAVPVGLSIIHFWIWVFPKGFIKLSFLLFTLVVAGITAYDCYFNSVWGVVLGVLVILLLDLVILGALNNPNMLYFLCVLAFYIIVNIIGVIILVTRSLPGVTAILGLVCLGIGMVCWLYNTAEDPPR
jgi:hypothetical protein